MSALLALKQRLAEVTGAPIPGGPAPACLPTGIDALDRALAGGIPRGRLTEIAGPRGGGKTTLVRCIIETATGCERSGGEAATTSNRHATRVNAQRFTRVAYIDAGRTLVPRDWAHVEALWVIRPPTSARGAWSADVLLRSGAFGLVILDSAPPLTRAVTARLTQVARESDAALVALGDDGEWRSSALGATVRLRVASGMVIVDKGGGSSHHHAAVEVPCDIGVARRLYPHPEVPDRRGVARAGGRGRSPRCGEPAARLP